MSNPNQSGSAGHSNVTDRFNIHAQLEHLQQKYPGTGHAYITGHEFMRNISRDTLASHAGHIDRLLYFSVAENESVAVIRNRMLRDMIHVRTQREADNEEKRQNEE